MLLEEVATALNWHVELPFGKFLLAQDSAQVEGHFLVHHVVDSFLQAGEAVCVVGLARSLSHYTAVSKKMGHNLASAKHKEQFFFVDRLSESSSLAPWTAADLQAIYREFQATLTRTDKSICFVIDDLTMLVDLCERRSDVITFLRYCRTLCGEKVRYDLQIVIYRTEHIPLL